ncbi:MAG: response regulator [Melioribacteraceae bacterium]|nr:response regulator [Melioribacteraceae bacterium]
MKKILIVEDNEPVREEIAAILIDEGYQTFESSSIEYAFRLFKEHAPDVVLSDIKMPEGSGYDLLAGLQKKSINSKFAFIFLSANNSMEDVRFGMNLGADDYIIKPFSSEEIVSSIRTRIKKLNR